MTNILNFRPIRFVPINAATYNVAAGAGWVDTDVSATTGTFQDRLWLVRLNTDAVGGAAVGIRPHGIAESPDAWAVQGFTQLTHVDLNGHVDIVRNGATTTEAVFLGYFEGVLR